MAAVAGTAVVSGPVIAACSTGPTYDEWAATDGAAGRINLDEVQEAFKKSRSPTDFEKRVNQIYEGDGLVLIRSKQDGEVLTLEGYEDLNGNGALEDDRDDLLFSVVKDSGDHELRGHGGNSYYRSSFGAGDFLFTYLLISAISPRGYYYTTPRGYANSTLRAQRNGYRNTSLYRSQVSRNSSYFKSQKSGFRGSSYAQSSRNLGTARQGYMQNQRTSGSYKASGTGVRSSWGASSRSRGFSRGGGRGGGFRGGGGGTTIIGRVRP